MDGFRGAVASLLLASTFGLGACTSCCVARGTRVLTPSGWRRIEELEPGDTVVSIDPETGERVVGEVTAVRTAERECLQLSIGGERRLVCTSDHPVYDPDAAAYADAGDWATGERSALLAVGEGESVRRKMEDAETFVGVREVFDITVDTVHHNFVANGVVVHNKSPAQRICKVNGQIQDEGDECSCLSTPTGRVDCPSTAPRGSAEEESIPQGICRCISDVGTDADATDVDGTDGESDAESSDAEPDADDTGGGDAADDTSGSDGGDA